MRGEGAIEMEHYCIHGLRSIRIAIAILTLVSLPAGGAVAANQINSCTTIDLPGEYVLNQSILNSPASPACIFITSSNVIFDGAEYTISGEDTPWTYGVYVYNPVALINVTVRNLNVTDWYYGIYYNNTGNGTIRGNNASNNSNGIVLDFSSNNVLSGNIASYNVLGIYVNSSSSNNLSSNHVFGNGNGIIMMFSSNNNLSRNNASDNKVGIYLSDSSINSLNSNIVSNNNMGVILASSSNNNLSGNNVSWNAFFGIWLQNSSSNTLSDNNILNNGIYVIPQSFPIGAVGGSFPIGGIILDSSSHNNLSGSISSNNSHGIVLNSSSNNTLNSNIANSNNEYGIFLLNSSSNTIYSNIFNNIRNFRIHNSANSWNITKTKATNIIGSRYIGGNLWSDPNDTGFSQTCADSDGDGICDSSYMLEPGNIDYLPLAYSTKLIWVLVIILTGFIGALVYYFLIRKKIRGNV